MLDSLLALSAAWVRDKQQTGVGHGSSLTVWHATATKGLLMAVVTETRWSMTPSSSGLVTLARLKMFRTVSDRRFKQPRGSWALATSEASGAHSRLREQVY